jgi:hypothetical protein
MLLALLVAVVSVAIGVGIGLARSSAHRTLGPVRTFALVASFATVVLELLPRAVAGGGLVALAVFASAAALPWVAERIGARAASDRSTALRLEVGYVGLLVHHVGDGLGLGTFTGGSHAGHEHWDVLLAIGGHTVPVTAVVVLAYGRRASRGVAALRGGLFAAAIGVGIALAHAVPAAAYGRVEPFVTAAVAGLLLHVATHDWLEDPPVSGGARLVDILAGAAGVALVAGSGAAHEHEHGAIPSDDVHAIALRLACRYAPALLAATVLAALLERSRPPRPGKGGVFLAAILGATAGGGPDRGMRLAEEGRIEDRPTAIAFAMGSAGIALETLAALAAAFGPAFAAAWAAVATIAIGVTAKLSRVPSARATSTSTAHVHGEHAKSAHGDRADRDHAEDTDHDHAKHADHDHAGHDHAAKVVAPRTARRDGWPRAIEESFGRVGGPAILGIAIAAVLELGLRDGSVAQISQVHADLLILPLVALAVALPPLAWVPPMLVLVDKGAYAPAALVAVAAASTNRHAVMEWARAPMRARAAGWLVTIAIGAVLVYFRWPPSPARQLRHEVDPIGLVCVCVLGLLMLGGLLRRGVRPWLALGVGTSGHDHGPCFEESARVTPVPPPAAPPDGPASAR